MKFLNLILIVVGVCLSEALTFRRTTTAQRILENGYPAETHELKTSDGYILQMFRIPNGRSQQSEDLYPRPIALLMHGLFSSSDSWVLNGIEQALAYALSDEGFDVWMGNFRGNTYSRKHVSYSTLFPRFWNFDWHHMGIFDLPAMIDYTLNTTNQLSLHYIGHSQGTTALMVMLSLLPEYNMKIRTAQMLAPVGYTHHLESPLGKVLAPLLGQPNAIVELLGSREFLPSNRVLNMLGAQACKDNSPFQFICSNILFLMGGYNTNNMNTTLLPEIAKTHPAGSSVNQVMHYLQEKRSKKFRQFDYGTIRNLLTYEQKTPPEYEVEKITAPVYVYYSENDWMAALEDVEELMPRLANVQLMHKMSDSNWTHLDFLWAINVKERLFLLVIDNMVQMEGNILNQQDDLQIASFNQIR